jgi:hypothetical protein
MEAKHMAGVEGDVCRTQVDGWEIPQRNPTPVENNSRQLAG